MGGAIVAVLGTLAGALLAGVLQLRAGAADRTAAEAERRRDAFGEAVSALVAALDAHRLAMWQREELRLAGEQFADARAASHGTRAALSGPATRVQLLAPAGVREAARRAETAAYALRAAPDQSVLADRREAARAAVVGLVDAAAAHLAA